MHYFQDFGSFHGQSFCWISLALKWQRDVDSIPSSKWWADLREEIRPHVDAGLGVKLSKNVGVAPLSAIRAAQSLPLVIEYEHGKAVAFFDPEESNPRKADLD